MVPYDPGRLETKRMPSPRNKEEWDVFWQTQFTEAVENPHGTLLSFARSFPTWKGHQTLRLVNFSMDKIMARGKNNGTQKTATSSFQPTKFVDIPISDEDWPDILKTYGSAETLTDAVSDLLEKGYRIGLTFNSNNDAFICAITCRDSSSPNDGCTFNSFAETWFEALQIGMYKHYVKTRGDWSLGSQGTTRKRFG